MSRFYSRFPQSALARVPRRTIRALVGFEPKPETRSRFALLGVSRAQAKNVDSNIRVARKTVLDRPSDGLAYTVTYSTGHRQTTSAPSSWRLQAPTMTLASSVTSVDLRSLVVIQGHIDIGKARELVASIDTSSEEALFNLAMGIGPPGSPPASISRISVKRVQGRLVLVDGHHRCGGLLEAGKRSTMAVVVDSVSLSDVPFQPVLFNPKVVLGEHPPMLKDFFEQALYVEFSVM